MSALENLAQAVLDGRVSFWRIDPHMAGSGWSIQVEPAPEPAEQPVPETLILDPVLDHDLVTRVDRVVEVSQMAGRSDITRAILVRSALVAYLDGVERGLS